MRSPPTVTCFTTWNDVLGATVIVLALAGCGKSYHVAEVDGIVLIGDKPGHKIYVQFIPAVVGEASPPTSTAETDAEGRFTLRLMERNKGPVRQGAVVGNHRVVLRDLQLAESATGKGVPIRLSAEYTLPGSTPLTQEVQEGKQTIEIRVPSK